MKLTDTIKIRAGVEWTDADGEVILLDLAQGRFYGLDEVGAQIWKSLAEGNHLSDILKDVGNEYQVEPSVLEADTLELLQSLVEKRFVEVT